MRFSVSCENILKLVISLQAIVRFSSSFYIEHTTRNGSLRERQMPIRESHDGHSGNNEVKIYRITADHIDAKPPKNRIPPRTVDIVEYEEKKIDTHKDIVSTMISINKAREDIYGIDSKPSMFQQGGDSTPQSEKDNRFRSQSYFLPSEFADKKHINDKLERRDVRDPNLEFPDSKSNYESYAPVLSEVSRDEDRGLNIRRSARDDVHRNINFSENLDTKQNRIKRGNFTNDEILSTQNIPTILPKNIRNIAGIPTYSKNTPDGLSLSSNSYDQTTDYGRTTFTADIMPIKIQSDSSNVAFNFKIETQPEANFSFRIDRNIFGTSSDEESFTYTPPTSENSLMTLNPSTMLQKIVSPYLTNETPINVPEKIPRNIDIERKSVEKKAAVQVGSITNKLSVTERKVLNLQEQNLTFPSNFSLNNTRNVQMIYNLMVPLLKNIQKQSEGQKWVYRNGSVAAKYFEAMNEKGLARFLDDSVFYVGKASSFPSLQNCPSCGGVLKTLSKYPFTVASILAFCCMILAIFLVCIYFCGRKKKKALKQKKAPFNFTFPGDGGQETIRYTSLKCPGSSSESSSSGKEREHGQDDFWEGTKAAPPRIKNKRPKDYVDALIGKVKEVRDKAGGASELAKMEHSVKESAARRIRKIRDSGRKMKKTTREVKDQGIFQWLRIRIAKFFYPDRYVSDSEEDEEQDIEPSDVSKRRKLRPGKKEKHSPFWHGPIQKKSMADLHTVISGVDMSSSSIHGDVGEPSNREELLSRVTKTGSTKIDEMLTGPGWNRSFYLSRGIDTFSDKLQPLDQHGPDEREIINETRLTETEGRVMGVLSKTSSTHSLLNQIGKSINKAECFTKNPRPLPSHELKAKM